MALQTSGPISFSDIFNEMYQNLPSQGAAISLDALVGNSHLGTSRPYPVGMFYGYTHIPPKKLFIYSYQESNRIRVEVTRVGDLQDITEIVWVFYEVRYVGSYGGQSGEFLLSEVLGYEPKIILYEQDTYLMEYIEIGFVDYVDSAWITRTEISTGYIY